MYIHVVVYIMVKINRNYLEIILKFIIVFRKLTMRFEQVNNYINNRGW